jgi:tetratricopeptide (TPR) repeat protein
LFRSQSNRVGEADTLDSLGYAYAHLGRHDEAVEAYEASIALWRDLGDRYNAADLLTRLGDIHLARADVPAARAAWTEALEVFTALDHPDGDAVRTRLDELGEGPVRAFQP